MADRTSFLPMPSGAYSDLAELVQLRHGARDLKLKKQRKTFSPLIGPHQSRFRGRGIEFDEVRAYQAGDDVRNIDWRVTARSGRPHTKLFHEERERPVLLLVDQGLPMFFGSKGCFKSVMAAHVAALLAWAALQQNDRVGGLVFCGAERSEIRPKRNSKTVLRLLRDIDAFNRRLHRQLPSAEVGLCESLEELRRITRPGSNIFIVSDFRNCHGDGKKHLHQLSRHNDIVAVQIYDPLEQHLPPSGAYSVTDGSRRAHLFTGDSRLRNRYQQNFVKKTEALRQLMGPMGIPLLQVSTQDSPLNYFRNLLGKR